MTTFPFNYRLFFNSSPLAASSFDYRIRYAENWSKRILLALAGCVVLGGIAVAQPYRPKSDGEILETLPRSFTTDRSELAKLRRQLTNDPKQVNLAVDMANRYLAIGNSDGDPRYYGYARAAIEPWWDANDPPADVLRLRAKLKEKNHDFNQALADVELLVRKEPRDVQAHLELVTMYQLRGDYAAAAKTCEQLQQFAGPFEVDTCRVPILATTGQAEEAYELLSRLVPVAKQVDSGVVWMLTKQAEIAVALGRDEQAEAHFREGLSADPTNAYLLDAYADFLLDHDRAAEVVPLLKDHTQQNGTLLQAAIAARVSGEQQLAEQWTEELANRFQEIRLRDNEPSGRYESQFELKLKENPKRSLELALANWKQQKEYRDTRNVLEAALAAENAEAAQPVIDFLAKHRTQHVVLERLVQQLKDLP